MKLFIINTGYGMTQEELRVRVERMQQAAAPDTEIVMECMEKSDICIDSQLDVALVTPEIIEKGIKAQRSGFDAVGIYCTSDPGIRALREILDIPVIGGGMAAALTAAALGYRYSMITTAADRISEKREFLRECGLDPARIASVRSIEYDVLAQNRNPDREGTVRQLAKAAAECKEKDGADVIILGCLSFAGMGKEVEAMAGIPAVDPAVAMVGLAESLCRQKLAQSGQAYCSPPARRRSWGAGTIEGGQTV